MTRRVLLVGAGGHAKVVHEAMLTMGWTVAGYVDPKPAVWLGAQQFENDEAAMNEAAKDCVAVGIGGMSAATLEVRHALLRRYLANGHDAKAVIDSRAMVSSSAQVAAGVQILVGGIVNPNARLGEAAIVNTRATIEHDSSVGQGTHVAPGAIVLGAAEVGDFCMVGAGAIVLPGARVPSRTLIPAGAVYPR